MGQGSNLGPQKWELRVLMNGLPGKSSFPKSLHPLALLPSFSFSSYLFLFFSLGTFNFVFYFD